MLQTKHVPILHLRYPAKILIRDALDRDNWIGPRKRPLDRTSLGTGSDPEFRTLADFAVPIRRG